MNFPKLSKIRLKNKEGYFESPLFLPPSDISKFNQGLATSKGRRTTYLESRRFANTYSPIPRTKRIVMQPRLENRCWLEGNGSTRPRYFLASRRHYRWKLLRRSAALMADPSYDKPAALFHSSPLLFKLLSFLPRKCVFFLSFFPPPITGITHFPVARSRCNRRQLTTCKPRFIWVDLSVSCVHQKEKNDLLLAPLIYRPSGAERFSLMPPRTPLRLSCYTGIRLIADWSPRIEDIPSMVDETRDPMKCWL